MGLVDYSDSESESEAVQQKPTAPVTSTSAAPKKPFQKLLDRGKIVVNLPTASAGSETTVEAEQPPAKRVKTAGSSRFSNLGSFLPPPKKNAASAATGAVKKSGSAPAPGIHLRTAAEPAFIRGGNNVDTSEDGDGDTNTADASGLDLNPPNSRGPSIPDGQKPEEEVKLVGKPLMFKPLSVARKKAPVKSKKGAPAAAASTTPSATTVQNGPTAAATAAVPPSIEQEPPKRKKISLFSMGDDDASPSAAPTAAATGTYEPLFTNDQTGTSTAAEYEEDAVTSAYPTYQHPPAQQLPQQSPQHPPQQHTLTSLADSLDLTPAARRELFGRPNARDNASAIMPPNAKVINFDMEQEYARNEALRASGEQVYNPVRSIASGKHSLRQVVNMAQSNQSALEDSFARAKGSKRDAAGRYGWK
ncbi:Anaphase-promoting complex subunit 23 [Madurella fahalii]|uniref:Anaphase-promoting complex subunit 23 n=1 Tax=Madurella fahalii TaxID=1157608 RepID=A0ABQ0GRX9_9PEZI